MEMGLLSVKFIICFLIATIVYYIIPSKHRYIWLCLISYAFYYTIDYRFIPVLVFVTLTTFLGGIFIEKNPTKGKAILSTIITINILLLCGFKYGGFFIHRSIILPIGISFYMLQSLSYIIDVYKGKVESEHNILRYATYVAFFPTVTSGPIERASSLLKQYAKPAKLSYNNIREGFYLVVWGFFLKLVISDRIAIYVNTAYSDINTYTGFYLVVAALLYSIQIYTDFYGYSVLAKGYAKILGIDIMNNFESPYMSKNTAEFWNRWHISLSSWLKDYIYIPLGGNRRGRIRQYVNILIVFLISGMWHGATATFIVWGLLHGLYQVIGKVTVRVREKLNNILLFNSDSFSHRVMQGVITYGLVSIAWVLFRAESFAQAAKILKGMIVTNNIWIFFDDTIYNCGLNQKNMMVLIFAMIILVIADILNFKKICIRQAIMKQEWWFRYALLIGAILFIIVFGIWGIGYTNSGFIYLQF